MEDETFALRDVLRVLRRHRAQILAAIMLAVLAALVISFAQPKRYTAESQLLLGPAVPDAVLPDARGSSDLGPLGLDLPSETQARVVTSPLMASRVVRSLRLSPDQETLKELTKRVQAKAVTENLLLITTNAPTRLEAAALANGFAGEYLAYRRELANEALGTLARDYQRRAAALAREADRLGPQIRQATGRGDQREVARLTSQRNAQLDQSSQFARQSQAFASEEAAGLGVGEVIAAASPPTQASSPRPLRNVLIAVVLGVALGVSIALLREHTNDRIQTRDDSARVTGAPVLASIPRRRGLHVFGGRIRLPLPGWGAPLRHELVTVRLPESAASEAYRELRSTLIRRGLGTRIKRLLVTSVEAGPEVSETVANLAAVCGLSGLHTMAVSADLRRPQLHNYFGISSSAGLAAALDGDGPEGEPNPLPVTLPLALSVVDVPNLLVLPSGRATSSPGDLLAAAPLGEIFGMATNIAQLVIIEAPPILSGGDVLTLTAHADAILLVVRAGMDRETLAARAAAALDAAACPLMGIVLHGAWRNDDTVGAVDEQRRGDWSQGSTVVDLTSNWALPRPEQSDQAEVGRPARAGAAEQRRTNGD